MALGVDTEPRRRGWAKIANRRSLP
jgi:hypothetical protein